MGGMIEVVGEGRVEPDADRTSAGGTWYIVEWVVGDDEGEGEIVGEGTGDAVRGTLYKSAFLRIA